jgi:hypothetical protein
MLSSLPGVLNTGDDGGEVDANLSGSVLARGGLFSFFNSEPTELLSDVVFLESFRRLN